MAVRDDSWCSVSGRTMSPSRGGIRTRVQWFLFSRSCWGSLKLQLQPEPCLQSLIPGSGHWAAAAGMCRLRGAWEDVDGGGAASVVVIMGVYMGWSGHSGLGAVWTHVHPQLEITLMCTQSYWHWQCGKMEQWIKMSPVNLPWFA